MKYRISTQTHQTSWPNNSRPESKPADVVLHHCNNWLKNMREKPLVQILLLSFNQNSSITVIAICYCHSLLKKRNIWNIFNPWDSLSRFVSWKQPAFASEVGWHSQGTTPQIRAHFGHVTSAHEWWSNPCSPRDVHLPLDSLSGLSAFVCFSQFVQVFKWKCFCEIRVIVLKGLGRKF